jgi:DNA helicase II / ATP-dependent DNA helicase PcrA
MTQSLSAQEQKFELLYSKLNKEQQLATNTIYGPIMVLAGPGTGKTQILTMRIANLLRSEAQINASEILCITFTDAGRIAMRNRLNEIIGVEVAQKIAIHTFHSFCNEIIQSNLPYFDKDVLQQASELEQFTVIKKILDNLPVGHLFKNPKNPYEKTKDLHYFFSNIKKENLTAALILEKIEEYITQLLPLDESHNYVSAKRAGEKKPTYVEEIARYEKSKIAAQLYDTYIEKMLEANRYDFNDMIQWVIKALAKEDELRMRYAEQYQYILVDEYQDTNGAQNELIRLLCSESESPNLFVVGDDDQSIYRFQGASTENMQSMQKQYPELVTIQLRHNYRSYAEILDASENFVGRNTDRLKKADEPLIAHHGNGHTMPKLIGLQNPRQEMIYIALEIKKLHDKNILPKEIAVLFTQNKDCLELAKYLHYLNIPYHTKSKKDLLCMPLSKSIIDIMRYANAECDTPFSGNLMLFQILHFYFFGIDALDIAKLNLQSNTAAKMRENISGSLREYLQGWSETVNTAQFKSAPAQKIIEVYNTLQHFITDAQNLNLFILFRDIVKKCGVYEYILAQPNKIDLIDELTALFAFIEEETRLQPEMKLADFITLLDIMKTNDIKTDYYKTLGKDNGVQLLTIHSSKGLEFEHVFIGGMMANRWENKLGGNKGLRIPPNVFDENYKQTLLDKKVDEDKKKTADNEELRRLLYVASTRAKKEVTLSFYRKDAKDKEMPFSQFLLEFFPIEKIIENAIDDEAVSTAMMAAVEPIGLISDTPLNVRLIEKEYIDEQLKHFVMSVSALNNYIKCPLHFYFVNILRVPNGLNENASFGSAVHTAFEFLYTDIQKNNNEFPAAEEFITVFKKDMFKRRETFTTEGYQAKLEYGEEILKNYYNEKLLQTNTIVSLEYNAEVIWNGVPLKGFMDKLEFNGNDVNIVDYKTGKFDGAYATKNMRSPFNAKGEKTNEGGSYWRQGAFYNLLLSLDKKNNWNPVSSEFVFVEPVKPNNEYKTKMYAIGANDVELVKEQVLDAWNKIQNHEFYTGCNEVECDWCSFVKQHSLQDKLDEVK